MSLFDKIVTSLIEPAFKSLDFTNLTGFIGCYTSDPDKPTGEKQFLVAFDNAIRNDYTKDLSIRLSKSLNVKDIYTKRVNNKSYYIYSFYVNPEIKKYYSRTICMPMSHKMKFIKMWTEMDKFAEQICSNTTLQIENDEPLPLEDYQKSTFDKS